MFRKILLQDQVDLRPQSPMITDREFRQPALQACRHADGKLGHFFGNNLWHNLFVTQKNPLDNYVIMGYFGF